MDDATAPRLLIVDDEPLNVKVLVDVLKDDYTLVVAKDGEQALRRVADADVLPDLVLLDVMMPVMDGHEVCRRLKADPATAVIPVIFVTAMSQDEDEAAGFALGAVDYITKPISPEKVKARVRTHLALKAARADLEEKNALLEASIKVREDMERIMRHDLKGPLNAIIGFPQILLEGDDVSERTVKILTSIRDSGYRMLNMINMSLDLVRMERGSYETAAIDVSVVDSVAGVCEELRPLLDAYGINRTVEVPPDMRVLAEELLLHSLIVNLMKNAIEASPSGGDISVRATREPGVVRLRIENTGEVPGAIRDRFFEKYVTSGKQGGTGLGTYSARLMAETLDGTLTLDCETPGRTAVVLTLPRTGAV